MTKIMLVEDDNNLREIYEARLAAEGYEIVSAPDGEAALAMAAKERPELIISDVMMPKISGFEMLDIIRNTEGIKNAKVIMLTALGQSEDSARAASLGADRYLVKSQVTLEDIVKATHELLNPSESPASVIAPSTPEAEVVAPAVNIPAAAPVEPVEIPEPSIAPAFAVVAPPAQSDSQPDSITNAPADVPSDSGAVIPSPPATIVVPTPDPTDSGNTAAPVAGTDDTQTATDNTDSPTPTSPEGDSEPVAPAPVDAVSSPLPVPAIESEDQQTTVSPFSDDSESDGNNESAPQSEQDGLPVIESSAAAVVSQDAPAEHLFGEPKPKDSDADAQSGQPEPAAPTSIPVAVQDEAPDTTVNNESQTAETDTPPAAADQDTSAGTQIDKPDPRTQDTPGQEAGTIAPAEQVAEAAPQGIAEEEAAMQARIDSFIKDQDVSSDTDDPTTEPVADKPVYNMPIAGMAAADSANALAAPTAVAAPIQAPAPVPPPVFATPAPQQQQAPQPSVELPPVPAAPIGQTIDQNIHTTLQQMTTDMATSPTPTPAAGPQASFGMPVAPPAAAPVAPVQGSTDSSVVAGKKVIAPISEGPKLDIHQLLEVEEAKVAARQASAAGSQPIVMTQQPPATPPSNSVVTSSQQSPGDPNSIAL